MTPQPGDALVIVDAQNDFLTGGALAVLHGDEVIPVFSRWALQFAERGLPVVATRDWHPATHYSFRAQGGPWPPHCVADTSGARFAPALALPDDAILISKAITEATDAYSGFAGTNLDARLKALGVRRLFVGGLATDYCVLNTVKDARALGYEVIVLRDAIRAVNVKPGDGARAEAEMETLGAMLLTGAGRGA